MSLYNMVNGVNKDTFFILPMLGKHPNEYPRFRDCFAGKMSNSSEKRMGIPIKQSDDSIVISVYMRIGGNNRDGFKKEIGDLRSSPYYLEDYDDDFDNTFATFVFTVPEEYLEDFTKIKFKGLDRLSGNYVDILYKTFPKLKETYDKVLWS